MDISILIVSYNSKIFLRECIDSIEKNILNKIKKEIIVVDNASGDGSAETIRNSFKDVILVENKENLGFSKANNIGIKKSKGNYILFLNPDTLVREKSIETLLGFLDEHTQVGAVACKVELPNGEIDDASHRGFPTPWNSFCYFSGLTKLFPHSKLFSGYTMGWKDLSTIHEIDACGGAVMLVRRKAGDDVKWWDEDYFFYGEDLDFCYRLKQKGWKIFYYSNVSILHYKGVSSGIKDISKDRTTANKETRNRASKARFDAMRIFYKKHYEKKYPRFVSWLVHKGIDIKEKL
ncbi:MAG: hypothetical protein A3F31_04795 [Candidatus Levybacteria bacterium RIFCSPHIGHO2_12_FULL_38_12]|nr:MAG: hypothetical protein A3D75_01110 [Candidatus Levybacteria bacterium RIFCSPHIGHO2_02_FULL_37_18]OGH22570.1 MAG: hypothetical protein A3F31_04795 [Candidatus Levybacteria bacterium RIFCSPHIGHO2_12_FULL_38_12]OGH33393.1 MAG: hypothetical protein A3A47_04060 [Candidatus Levybacteria bacterium RIFCSPLOWO2_01_FULL_37_20]OGH44108.1 MAG: hypothetical protein A3J14_05165 [Candidatus Levybacteria bacterium RIFCSPLOWO2_02_FULL_37_18]